MKANPINEVSPFLTISKIRRILNISQSAAYQLAKRKDFPVSRFGGNIRIPREAFFAWVDARTFIPTVLT